MTWKHPKLGVFKHDGLAWWKFVTVPAFKAFSYDTGYPNARRSTGKVELSFAAPSEKDLPKKSEVVLADKVIANAQKLVSLVKTALWDEFNGRGPVSGLWWRGDLRTIAEQIDMYAPKLSPPRNADDILALMQLYRIAVRRKDSYNYDRTMVELSFHAAFEGEHGVGILTDGTKILGSGYSSDVQPYKPPRKRTTTKGKTKTGGRK